MAEPVQIEHRTLRYKDNRYTWPTDVQLRVWLTAERKFVVVLTELHRANHGPSITNSIETAWAKVMGLFGNDNDVEVYEHYARSHADQVTFDAVTMEGDRPRWRHVPPAEREQIAERCGIPVDELLADQDAR